MKFKTLQRVFIFLIITATLFVAGGEVRGSTNAPVFDVITVSSAITPAVAKYIMGNIHAADEEGSGGLIILLDTPGGLDLAMRDIVKELLNARIPVIVYVYPSGARAASAGVMITMAAHIAAMAPGTNIGAAHPVAMGVGGKMDETMKKKVVNDAVAYVRGIAEKKNRNADWAENAVRESESITADDAKRLNVIDIVAGSIQELLTQIDGREVETPEGTIVLTTNGAVINEKEMGIREKVLTTLSDPNIAYLLLMIGLAGLYFEFSHPGAILPGVVGGISLILAFFAMQTLPINAAGILLIMFSVILFFAEIKIVSYGMLTVAGVISLVLGSLLLFDSPVPALRVSFKVMIPTIIIVSLFFIAVVSLAVKAQRNRPKTGREGMIGEEGTAVTTIHANGKVAIRGESWNAFSREPIDEGQRVKVTGLKGLVLEVEQIIGNKEDERCCIR
jgi:membrane-bound serine protease (ClpP class)